eukprot:jgi/Chrzof1/8065/UNPLg00110.t1
MNDPQRAAAIYLLSSATQTVQLSCRSRQYFLLVGYCKQSINSDMGRPKQTARKSTNCKARPRKQLLSLQLLSVSCSTVASLLACTTASAMLYATTSCMLATQARQLALSKSAPSSYWWCQQASSLPSWYCGSARDP